MELQPTTQLGSSPHLAPHHTLAHTLHPYTHDPALHRPHTTTCLPHLPATHYLHTNLGGTADLKIHRLPVLRFWFAYDYYITWTYSATPPDYLGYLPGLSSPTLRRQVDQEEGRH